MTINDYEAVYSLWLSCAGMGLNNLDDSKEGIETWNFVFKRGTFNSNYEIYFEPIFKNLKNLEVKHCKSEKIPMIRLADITANYLYSGILNDKPIQKTIYIKMLP